MVDETEHGPHGPGCACHKDTDEIREEHIEELRDADVFAGVAISIDEDGEPSASIARAFNEDIPLPTMLGLQQMLDKELHDLIGGQEPSGGLESLLHPDGPGEVLGEGIVGMTAEEAEEHGILDMLRQMGGPDMSPETDEDIDGVEISLEDDDDD